MTRKSKREIEREIEDLQGGEETATLDGPLVMGPRDPSPQDLVWVYDGDGSNRKPMLATDYEDEYGPLDDCVIAADFTNTDT